MIRLDYVIHRSERELSERKLETYSKYAEIITWGRKFPVKFCERFFGIEFLDHQKYVFMNSWTTPRVVWCQCRGSGKALALDTPIPTVCGVKNMSDIKVGDCVLDIHGFPTRVTYTSEIFIGHDCYAVEFEDGEVIVADEDHLWSVCTLKGSPFADRYGLSVIDTRHIYNYYTMMTTDIGRLAVPTPDYGFKYITGIRSVDSVPTKCIKVDNERELFQCGSHRTVTHNTTLVAPFTMAKSVLIPRFQTYIMSGVGSQSQECFLKIEKIAKKEIASFTGLTDFFLGEIESGRSDKDGFIHGAASFSFKLFNDSRCNSLNGAFDNNRSKRSNLNIYDESGFAPEDLFTTSMPFITQDSNFQLGGEVQVELRARQFPNQAIFASSASDMSTYFYRSAYKAYAKKMLMGDRDYFVADINADIVFNATYNGKLYPVSLLSRENVEDELHKNKDKASREFYNRFTVDGGDKQPFKRSMFMRNSEMRLPVFEGAGERYVIAYDPARTTDNSFALVGELYNDAKVGLKLRIVNGVNFIDKNTRNKTPMRSPDQRRKLKSMILDYNGKGAADYENFEMLLIDSGAGGGGRLIGDEFMEEWSDPRDINIMHKGLLDFEEHKDYRGRFPNALNKQMLVNPRKNKVLMFDALVEMLNQDLISFTQYDGKDFITLFEDGDEYSYIDDDGSTKTERERKVIEYKLSDDEAVALQQIELMKEETINMYRYESNCSIRYDLAPDKQMGNDDRAYCLAMLAWYLQKLRSGQITKKEPQKNYDNAEICSSSVEF